MNQYREATKCDEYWNAHEDGVNFQGLKDFWEYLETQMTIDEWSALDGAKQQAVYFGWLNGDTTPDVDNMAVIKNALNKMKNSIQDIIDVL